MNTHISPIPRPCPCAARFCRRRARPAPHRLRAVSAAASAQPAASIVRRTHLGQPVGLAHDARPAAVLQQLGGRALVLEQRVVGVLGRVRSGGGGAEWGVGVVEPLPGHGFKRIATYASLQWWARPTPQPTLQDMGDCHTHRRRLLGSTWHPLAHPLPHERRDFSAQRRAQRHQARHAVHTLAVAAHQVPRAQHLVMEGGGGERRRRDETFQQARKGSERRTAGSWVCTSAVTAQPRNLARQPPPHRRCSHAAGSAVQPATPRARSPRRPPTGAAAPGRP